MRKGATAAVKPADERSQLRLETVKINCLDWRRMFRFYHEVLGLRCRGLDPGAWAELEAGPGVKISLVKARWLEGAPKRPLVPEAGPLTLMFMVPDLDDMVQRLRRARVKLPKSVEEHPWGRTVAVLDPEGNTLRLWAPTRL